MKKRFAVIGLGHFGLNLSLHLTERGAEVLAIDNKEERVELLRDRVSHAMVLDAKDPRALSHLGLQDMDAVIVAIGEDFEASILATAHLQQLGINNIVNRVVSPVHEKLLQLMKIDDLILPESEAASQLARRLTMTGALEALAITEDFSIVEVKVPKAFVGKTVQEADIRRRYNVNLVTVMRKKNTDRLMTLGQHESVEVLGVPTNEFVFSADDILVLFGKEKHIAVLSEN